MLQAYKTHLLQDLLFLYIKPNKTELLNLFYKKKTKKTNRARKQIPYMFSETHFDHTRPKFATSIRVNITNSLVKKDKIVTKKINMKRSSYGDSKISSKNKRDKEKK